MTNNATKVEVTYSGKMDGLTFEKFDDLVVLGDVKSGVTSTLLPYGKMNYLRLET